MSEATAKTETKEKLEEYLLDATRHQSIFSPEAFGDTRIDVIGAGATGSYIVLQLAKLGIRNIHVWDFDVIEAHNLANQLYGPKHIGMAKVDALRLLVHEMSGVEITAHNERVEANTEIEGKYVFLLVDSIEARKEIGEECLSLNMTTKFVVETRMGVELCNVETFNPQIPSEFDKWFANLPDEAVVETSACGTAITVGATAQIVVGLAIWQFLAAVNNETKTEPQEVREIHDHIMMSVRPHLLMTMSYKG